MRERLGPGVGPASIFATYYGNKSNSVVVEPIAAEPVTLELKANATTLHPGDTGMAVLVGQNVHTHVELAPDQTTFKSSDEKVLKIDAKSGSYHAIAPGEATVTGSYAVGGGTGLASGTPATLRFTVTNEKSPHGDRPTQVRILSDQGKTVKFPVGAAFDDFRVEAQYADGYTRVVTRKATITTAEKPEQSPVAVENGRLRGVRAGQTHLGEQFEGVEAKEPLAVEVTGGVDADELRIEPAPLVLLRGETVPLRAIGYKNGKSIGSLGELGRVRWESTDPKVAWIIGADLIGIALGKCEVTATLPGVKEMARTAVSVVDSIAANLKFELGTDQNARRRVGADWQRRDGFAGWPQHQPTVQGRLRDARGGQISARFRLAVGHRAGRFDGHFCGRGQDCHGRVEVLSEARRSMAGSRSSRPPRRSRRASPKQCAVSSSRRTAAGSIQRSGQR